MIWEDKSHGQPLEDGLYEGHAIKRECFFSLLLRAVKPAVCGCVFFFSFFF